MAVIGATALAVAVVAARRSLMVVAAAEDSGNCAGTGDCTVEEGKLGGVVAAADAVVPTEDVRLVT